MTRTAPSRRALLAGAATLAVAVGTALAAGPAVAAPATGTVLAAHGTPIADSYVVVLKDAKAAPGAVRSTARGLTSRYAGTVTYTYTSAVRGFATRMTAERAKRLAADPRVASVQQDSVVTIDATQSPATWGLDRIDQRALPLSNSYTYDTTASNVNSYIIDTGIRTSHTQFGGRARVGYDAVGDGQNGQDCNGHGTHVAGTVGGSTYGVAKATQLWAVRVLSCSGSGSNAGVIAGVDWVTANAVKPAVANMSLGGGASSALDTAVRNSIASGVTYALAAGNSNADACTSSPARTAEAITVGATTSTDARASYSNYGTCLDIFAPGSSITSSWNTGDTATNTISGTSMASPHVAGVAALYLAANPTAAPSAVRNALVAAGTTGVVSNPGPGSPNVLLYTGTGSTPPPPPPPGSTFTNDADVAIPDAGPAVTSPITVTGRTGNAPSALQVAVDIRHTYRGDLVVDLLAPDGSTYRLKNSSYYDSADNVIATYTVNASSEVANGTWRLQVRDVYSYDTGYVNSWSLTF
jgi:subtilisin family serine protease